jgi:hypothetical protein
MSRTKIFLLGNLTILALVVGCPLLPGKVGYIKLQIDTTAASKGIEVVDFEVIGLQIQVRDPVDELLKTIDWEAEEGPRYYLIPAKHPGEHKIEVTHFGGREGEVVQASESTVFDVRAKVITVIEVVPGSIGVIRVESGEEE